MRDELDRKVQAAIWGSFLDGIVVGVGLAALLWGPRWVSAVAAGWYLFGYVIRDRRTNG